LYVKVDITRPTIRIVQPVPDEVLVSKQVEVSGWASDNMELREIQISMDGRNWSPASGKSSWNGSLQLSVGLNNIFVRAADATGNTNQTVETVLVDIATPTVNILQPTRGQVFRPPGSPVRVEIRGTAWDDAMLVQVEYNLDGTGWMSTKGNLSWSGSLKLDPGKHVIYVRATDAAGRMGYDNVTVTVDIPVSLGEMWPLFLGTMIIAVVAGVLAWKKLRRRPGPGNGANRAQ
jgi:hypothetical protein